MYQYESDADRRTDPALKHYLRAIGRHALLDREEEAEMARRIRGGDQEALDRLINGNLRFVVSVAKQYLGRGLGIMDLIAEGNVGLITAARRFDEQRGFRFVTYASWWVRQTIRAALQDQPRTVRLPANRARDATRIARLERRLEQGRGGPVDDQEIAARLDLDAVVVARIRGAMRPTSPLEQEDDDERPALAGLLADPTVVDEIERLEQANLAAAVGRALGELDDRDRTVLTAYFGLDGNGPRSLEDIGAALELSRERVRQLRNRAFRRLQEGAAGGLLAEFGDWTNGGRRERLAEGVGCDNSCAGLPDKVAL